MTCFWCKMVIDGDHRCQEIFETRKANRLSVDPDRIMFWVRKIEQDVSQMALGLEPVKD